MQNNFGILKDFIVVEKGIIICAQGVNVNVSPMQTQI